MIKFQNTRTYALVTGLILFTFGFIGFAFRSSFDVGGQYLIISLILGFWGIILGSAKKSA